MEILPNLKLLYGRYILRQTQIMSHDEYIAQREATEEVRGCKQCLQEPQHVQS